MGETKRIRVIVVDDHAVVRSGIEYSLMAIDDIELVGSADKGADAVRLCEELQPDVVLMDMMMPEMDGVSATRAVLKRCPQVRVIALTSFQEGSLVQKALQAGAMSYLLKDVGMEELAAAIRSAASGQGTLAPEAAKALAEAASKPASLGVRSHRPGARSAGLDRRRQKQCRYFRDAGHQSVHVSLPREHHSLQAGRHQSRRSGRPGCEARPGPN